MKTKLGINDFAKLSFVTTIKKNELKNIKGGMGAIGIPPGLQNFPLQAQGCPPPIQAS